MNTNEILQSTMIKIPPHILFRSRDVLDNPLSSISSSSCSPQKQRVSSFDEALRQQHPVCTDALATVLMAKRNSFTVTTTNSNNNNTTNFYKYSTADCSSDSPLSSSPESTFSEFTTTFDDCSSLPFSNPSISKSCLSSVTSLGSNEDGHPLSFNDSDNDDIISEDDGFFITKKSKDDQEKNSSSLGLGLNDLTTNFIKSFKKFAQSSNSANQNTMVIPPVRYYSFMSNYSSSQSGAQPTLFQSKPANVEQCEIVPLKTFNIQTIPLANNWDLVDSMPSNINSEEAVGYPFNNCRSIRSSPLFLKLYAIEKTAQSKRLIPNIFKSEEESSNHSMYHFYDDDDEDSDDEEEEEDNYCTSKEYFALGEAAKLKLFKQIKLQPREDLPIESSLKNVEYIDVAGRQDDDTSLINNFGSKHDDITPWMKFDSNAINARKRPLVTLKAHGVMKNSNVQFTVKGYANPRWVDKSHSS
ncbi:hypothetical protein DASC09_002790 [Saccharomycopsis crataegensis]|uniref:Uncharacterized protein n=1 Tax=Saccharomycopsis crataegensis TaxID=43959 RepID=A0AAV5QF31_9ASCO|nr:hypothetical protein DASC09_002790 [Saccharomycopsis crataegensis]